MRHLFTILLMCFAFIACDKDKKEEDTRPTYRVEFIVTYVEDDGKPANVKFLDQYIQIGLEESKTYLINKGQDKVSNPSVFVFDKVLGITWNYWSAAGTATQEFNYKHYLYRNNYLRIKKDTTIYVTVKPFIPKGAQ